MKFTGYLLLKCFVKFSCETVQSRAFVCQVFFDFCFHFIRLLSVCSCFLFLLHSGFQGYTFQEISPFHLGFQISWRIDSNLVDPLYFCAISCNLSSFISDFLFWVFSLFLLINQIKGLLILFIFSKKLLLELLIL